MGYFINNMTDTDKAKYRERSIRAINGIKILMSNLQPILACNTIKGKYYMIAQYIGLASDNDNSYYNYFIPTNSDIVFLLRFSDHNNTNPMLYNQHEQNGRPNKRYIIPFMGNVFQQQSATNFLEAKHHVVNYPVNALDDEASIKTFLSVLQQLFTNGDADFPQLPLQLQENKQDRNTNTIMKQKQTIKLNESLLRNIIKESIKKVLNENERDIDADTYFGGGLPDSYYQDPSHEQPYEYDDDEPSIPEDISNLIYERLKNQPDKVDRFDAKNLNALSIRSGNIYRELRNRVGEEDSLKYIREYVRYYLPSYAYVYNNIRHMAEDTKWLFNENS